MDDLWNLRSIRCTSFVNRRKGVSSNRPTPPEASSATCLRKMTIEPSSMTKWTLACSEDSKKSTGHRSWHRQETPSLKKPESERRKRNRTQISEDKPRHARFPPPGQHSGQIRVDQMSPKQSKTDTHLCMRRSIRSFREAFSTTIAKVR